MRFGILGPVQVLSPGGDVLPVGGARLRAMLALLIADVGHIVPAQRLIDGVYGADPPAGATNALQSQVSRLRQLLRDGPTIEFHPAGYRLAVDPEEVDAHRFRRLTEKSRATTDPRQALTLLTEALDLWRGPALTDAGDAPSVRSLAERLDSARLSAIEARIEAQLRLDPTEDLVSELRALVGVHPLRERLRGQLMRALQATGQPAAALLAFEDARRALADELGADPSAELRAVHLAVLRAPPQTASRSGLPAQLTSFVGRQAELDQLAELLHTHRLVTLAGPGGAGKTRLAIEAAGRHPDESYLVELAAARDGAEIVHLVLDALGLRDSALRPTVQSGNPVDRLVAALADRPVLLILDNCEHLVDAAATLADRLLRLCPSLRALATSREPLGITGERLLPVRPLGQPGPHDPLELVRSAPAVRLFADRAAAVSPDFRVDAENAADVLRICRMLDGQPLALELAAARLRGLPLAEVASRLDDRFRLLSWGGRTGPARHRTLRAAIEWSWDLLDDSERALARRLTVFSGGATLEAAGQICGFDDAELLAGLVDKSLVELADGRYRMLDTVRVFGEERLAEAGELKQVRRAHAEYFLDLALTADTRLRTADQLRWATILDRERDNLHAAVRWSIQDADATLGLRLVAALAMYSWIRGRRSEYAALARDLLETVGPVPPHELGEEHAMCVLSARLGGHEGTWSSAASTRAEPYVHYRPPRLPFLNVLSAVTAGPPEESQYGKLEVWYDDPGLDRWTSALQRFGLAYVKQLHAGDLAGAEETLEISLSGFRALGERWGTSMALAELGDLADGRGEHERFLALNDEAMRLAVELGSDEDCSDLLCRRATSHFRAGDLVAAETAYRQADELAVRSGASEVLTLSRLGLGHVAREHDDLAAARRHYLRGLADCPSGWYTADENRSMLLIGLGWIAYTTGDAVEAADRHRAALASGIQRFSPINADIAEGLAGAAQLAGRPDLAATLLGLAPVLRGRATPGFPASIGHAAPAGPLPDTGNYAAERESAAALSRPEAIAALLRIADNF